MCLLLHAAVHLVVFVVASDLAAVAAESSAPDSSVGQLVEAAVAWLLEVFLVW